MTGNYPLDSAGRCTTNCWKSSPGMCKMCENPEDELKTHGIGKSIHNRLYTPGITLEKSHVREIL